MTVRIIFARRYICVTNVGLDATCQPPKPATDALCRIIDGVPQWVVNSTLTVNDTVSFNEDVIIVGDLVVTSGTEVQLNSGATITVLGCPQINGSLAVNLTPEEIEELNNSGVLNRTALIYDIACVDESQFNQVAIKNQQGTDQNFNRSV